MGRARSGSALQRALAATLALAGAGLLAGACRDVVSDDVIDAASVLCDTLEACRLGRGCARVDEFFVGAAPGDVDDYLEHYERFGCADGCGAAPVCLDHPGVCAPPGRGCAFDVECCGGTSGEARCDPGVDPATCCLGLGVPCEADADCCPIEGQPVLCAPAGAVDPAEPAVSTCGGLPPCARLGESCGADGECCSGTCADGRCARITCVESGAPCEAGVDTCCEPTHSCEDGRCKAPDVCADPSRDPARCCASEGGACSLDGAGPDLPCCGESARCFGFPGGGTSCSTEGCGPTGAVCARDADCCQPPQVDGVGGPNTACLQVDGPGEPIFVCQRQQCEPDEGHPCGEDLGCCAGLDCQGGQCKLACDPLGPCEDPLEIGPPIDKGTCSGDLRTCVDAVCAVDTSCCCFAWDAFCVEQALGEPSCAQL